MESSIDELGKLKYSIALEISLQEMKPTYDAVYRELKKTRHNGFRPGRHPKGWLEKRFLSAMQAEAVERVIPGHMENALKEHSLKPATMPIIKKIEFTRNSPLSATLDFEIAPSLPPLDYSRLKLERKKIKEVSDKQISEELELLLKRNETIVPKTGNEVKVELNDCVKINYQGLIEGNEFTGSHNKDVQFIIGGTEYKEFHDALIGMVSGDEKNLETILSDQFGENKGKKANFNFQLTEIFSVLKTELDENFFKKFGVESLDELKVKIGENIRSRNKDELQTEYRMSISSQIPDLYDEFELPEQLVNNENEKKKKELEQGFADKEISEKEKDDKLKDGLSNVKKDLRIKFILDSISEHENLIFDENEAAKEFVGLAQMTGQSPDKLFQSQFGREIYQRILVRKKGDLTLDRVIDRVFGDPVDQNIPEKNKHVHDDNCEHNHK